MQPTVPFRALTGLVLLTTACFPGPAPGNPAGSQAAGGPASVVESAKPAPGPDSSLAGSVSAAAADVTAVEISGGPARLVAPYGNGWVAPGLADTLQLSAVVRLSGGFTSQDVEWSSSAPGIATVDSAGLLKALPGAGPGRVTVTASAAADRSKRATVEIDVAAPASVVLDLDPGGSGFPASARTIRYEILGPAGEILSSTDVARPSGGLATASLAVPSGTWQVRARVMDDPSVYEPLPGAQPAVVAVATGSAAPASYGSAAVTLTPVAAYVPTIGLSGGALSAQAGGTLVVSGTHFGASRKTTFEVRLGGVKIEAYRLSETRIDAIIPAGAASGDLQVFADAVPGATAAVTILN